MAALSLEYGIDTDSWYAEFALRRRVSMSAMGSVIVIGPQPFLAAVSLADLRRSRLPAALRDTRELAGQGHLAQADAAQSEFAVHGPGTPTPLAAGVATNSELWLAVGFVDERGLGHVSSP